MTTIFHLKEMVLYLPRNVKAQIIRIEKDGSKPFILAEPIPASDIDKTKVLLKIYRASYFEIRKL
jgi:hypothetical protein